MFPNATGSRSFFPYFPDLSNLVRTLQELSQKVSELLNKNNPADSATETSYKVTKAVLPYVVVLTGVATGVPLLIHYLYKKALKSLDKPKLASETYKADPKERLEDVAKEGLKTGLLDLAEGLKWGTLAGSAGLLAMVTSFVTGATSLSSEEYLQRVGMVSFGVTGGVTLSRIASRAFEAVSEFVNAREEPKPIFEDKLASQINDIAESARNIQANGGFFQNVLLYGPGGTGKTMVAKAIAKHANMNYVFMSGGDLSKFMKKGEHVTELHKLFDSIQKPTILFFDEIDAFASDRNKMDRSELFEVLSAFLERTGAPSKKVMIIAATNMPNVLDPAVLSRMDHKLLIAAPALNERREILQQYISYFFTQRERDIVFTQDLIGQMAEETEGLTGRALFKMMNAIHAKKTMSQDNVLRTEMVYPVVEHFVEQERELEKMQTQSLYKKLAPRPGKLIRPGAEKPQPPTKSRLNFLRS